MATLVQRSSSMLSVEYFTRKQDYSMMDADAEICRLFGSLNLSSCGAFQSQGSSQTRQPASYDVPRALQPEDASMRVESDVAMIGNAQPVESCDSPPKEDPIECCGLIQLLAAHYAPRLCGFDQVTHSHDTNFNFLETILAHREAYVAFPYGHRTCSSVLTKVAFEIERRHAEGGAYSEGGDIDTAIALHNEAWLMSGL